MVPAGTTCLAGVEAGMRAGKAGEGEVLACQGFLRKEDQPWTGR